MGTSTKVPGSSEASDEKVRLPQAADLGSMQVLLVEDDEVVCARLEALLARAQFDVHAVSSAREVREMMSAVVFPIVIIDRKLGDSDGI